MIYTILTVYYLITWILQLSILFVIFTEPGAFSFFEHELRNIYSKSKTEELIFATSQLVQFIFLIYNGITNVLCVLTLQIGTYYMIKFLVLNEPK